MNSKSISLQSICTTGTNERISDVAAPRYVECAVDDVEQLSDSQSCAAQLHPPNTADNKSKNLSFEPGQQSGHGDLLVGIMGTVQNVGLLFMAVSAFNLAMMATFVKLASNTGLSTWEIVFTRSLLVAIVCVIQLASSRTKPWGNRILMLHVRGVLGMAGVMSLFFAVQHLPVADAVVFTFLCPLIILVASPYFLGEDTGNQWLPILLATTGVLLICQPSFLFGKARLSFIGVMCGMTHAAVAAGAKMMIRALKEEHTTVKMLYLATYCIAVSGSAMLVDRSQWTFPSIHQAALMLGCGLAGLGAQTFMTMSLERVEASLGVGMTYTAIIWSELVGITLFHEIPNAWAVMGTVVVLYSTVHNSFMQFMSTKAVSDHDSLQRKCASSPAPDPDVGESTGLLKAQP